jgi:hypothetical protein
MSLRTSTRALPKRLHSHAHATMLKRCPAGSQSCRHIAARGQQPGEGSWPPRQSGAEGDKGGSASLLLSSTPHKGRKRPPLPAITDPTPTKHPARRGTPCGDTVAPITQHIRRRATLGWPLLNVMPCHATTCHAMSLVDSECPYARLLGRYLNDCTHTHARTRNYAEAVSGRIPVLQTHCSTRPAARGRELAASPKWC